MTKVKVSKLSMVRIHFTSHPAFTQEVRSFAPAAIELDTDGEVEIYYAKDAVPDQWKAKGKFLEEIGALQLPGVTMLYGPTYDVPYRVFVNCSTSWDKLLPALERSEKVNSYNIHVNFGN